MKIAILTLPLNVNIGGVLQAYALQKVLETMGHKAFHIQPSYELPSDKTLFKRLVKRFINVLKGKSVPEILEYELLDQFTNYHINQFRKRYLKEIPLIDWRYFTTQDYDAYIVGSDQIWRHQYSMQYFPNNFLSFTKESKCKRIAYAPSFGTDKWEMDDIATKCAKECVQRFDAISVREKTGVDFCKRYFGVDAECMLDPTMLLTKESYERIVFENDVPQSEGTLLSYFFDISPELQNFIGNIALDNKLIPFRVNNPLADHWQLPAMERQQYSVYKWIRGFMDAKLVLTDSFHACVFSIIFNKPFIVVANKDRGVSRFETLLSTFNLEERLVYNYKDVQKLINIPIDYESVNDILKSKREYSINYLKNALD